jgi:hypothetical protein
MEGMIGKTLYGIEIDEAQDKAVCVECGLPALPRCYSEEGKEEYMISGLCELCFDAIVEKEYG